MELCTMFLILLCLPLAIAHMAMIRPPPINGHTNNFAVNAMDSFLYTFPLKADGSNYPCHGKLSLLNSPEAQPVATWAAGSTQEFELAGSGSHYGGSGQLSLSYDNGKTFRVIKSYEGAFPNRPQSSAQVFKFKIPDDAPTQKKVLFAWSWHNRERESFMNCAVVDIVEGPVVDSPSQALSSYPFVFKANVGNDCVTPLTSKELKFPDPGSVVVPTDGEYELALPEGAGCAPGSIGQVGEAIANKLADGNILGSHKEQPKQDTVVGGSVVDKTLFTTPKPMANSSGFITVTKSVTTTATVTVEREAAFTTELLSNGDLLEKFSIVVTTIRTRTIKPTDEDGMVSIATTSVTVPVSTVTALTTTTATSMASEKPAFGDVGNQLPRLVVTLGSEHTGFNSITERFRGIPEATPSSSGR